MWLLRILLRLLPREFRNEYGSELLETAADRWREAATRSGSFARLRFWSRECLAVIRGAISLRRRRHSDGHRHPPDDRREGWTTGAWKDVQHAARSLIARPGFALVAVLTLGAGVGATTAMFSAVNAVLLRALPYQNANDVLVLKQTDTRHGSLRKGVSFANMRDVSRAARTLSHVAAANTYGFTLLQDGRGHSLRGWVVSKDFFEAIGGRAQLGRTFTPEEFIPGGGKAIVLSHGTWQSRFGGAADIIGRQLVLDNAAHTVVGVMPADFKYPSAAEIWAPRPPHSWDDEVRGAAGMHGVARLAPGATTAHAQGELDQIAAGLAVIYPSSNTHTGFRLIPLRQHLFGDVQSPLMLLLGAVGLVLLIAAANLAGLQLARGAGRSREYALRAALGASSRRILRLVFIEGLLLATAGGSLGIGLAYLGVNVIQALSPDHLPRIDELRIDGTVLAFAVATAVGSAVMAGVAPALRAARMRMVSTLADGSRASTRGPGTSRLRDRLVVAEIAVSLVLLIGAGLLMRSLDRLLGQELGFEPERRLAVQVFAYDESDRPDLDFVRRSLASIVAVPGVEAVGVTTALPLADNQSIWSMSGESRFTIDARAVSIPGSEPIARLSAIDGAYATAMGIALKTGRTFTVHDHPQSLPVAMVNDAFVRRYVSGREAVGSRITVDREPGSSREIVGVLGNVRPQGFESEPAPEIYVPVFQTPMTGGVTFVVKTTINPADLAKAIQNAIWTANPAQAVWASRPMTDLLWDWIRQRQFNTALLVAFATLALFLAAIGVYGLMSFSVEQRVNELGLRRALGGQTRDILGMVLRRALRLALAGAGLGLLGSAAVTRLVHGMLFDVDPFDPFTFAALSVFVIGVAMVAALVPALRATRIDPMVALRIE